MIDRGGSVVLKENTASEVVRVGVRIRMIGAPGNILGQNAATDEHHRIIGWEIVPIIDRIQMPAHLELLEVVETGQSPCLVFGFIENREQQCR